MRKNGAIIAIAFIFLFSSFSFAYEMSFFTDKYFYGTGEAIYGKGVVSQNSTGVSNVTVTFQAKDVSGNVANSSSLTSNSTGEFNYTFSLSSTGNYTLLANASGDYVNHFIKVKSYAFVLLSTDKSTYTAGTNGTLSIKVVDSQQNGVSGQLVTSNLRFANNNTLISNMSACTTNALGECGINFTAPSSDGQYLIEANNFENGVGFVVGGFEALMKVSPNVLGLNSEVAVRVTVKSASGNGVAASTRQLVITFPNNTEYTVTSMTQAVDSSGTSLTGAYEDRYNVTGEGAYKVKATIVGQGSNITRELTGAFDVRGYVMDIGPWTGQSVFYPGSSIALGIKLRNASSNDFISGKTSALLTGVSILDSSDQPVVVNVSISEFSSSYRVDFVMPSTASAGAYKLKVSLNDTLGTGSGTGYFSVQQVRATAVTLDTFPNGTSKSTFLAAQTMVVKFTGQNATGSVTVNSVNTYTIRDGNGNDKTALFGTGVNYTSGGAGYLNLSTPNRGGDYRIKARLNTSAGMADAEGSLFVDVLDIDAKPASIGGGGGGPGGFSPFGGPGFMFAFRPNDTISLNVTVKTASEKQEGEGFMGSFGGASGSGTSGGIGLFGIGGGSAVQGAQVQVMKVINVNTDEDLTSLVSGTLSCVTGSDGKCAIKLTPTTNGNNWTGGFYVVFLNASTSNNQTDTGQGFFEVRKYFIDVRTTAATTDNAASLGFQSHQSWNIGPNDNVSVTVSIREPGTWNTVSNTFNVTVLGMFYGGKLGEFVYPPKLISGTNATFNTSSANSTNVTAPSGGWKAGFYEVRVSVKDAASGQVDTAQGFMMSRIYDGFGFPVNPTTLQQDFTARSSENISLRISVYDVQRHAPAANLTVTKNKIMSFASFPPSDLSSYDQNVTQGTTDANGVVLMTLPAPTGGWPKGSFLAVFDVTNGSVTDSVQGFFQIKNFFAEISSGRWSFSTNESVAFNVTISSDPAWMRNMFGGCPAGDPGCSGGGGGGGMGPPPSGGGGGGFTEPSNVVVFAGLGVDLDSPADGVKDINITFGIAAPVNLSLPGNLTDTERSTQNLSLGRVLYCGSSSGCASGATSVSTWFEGFSCSSGALNTTDPNYRNHSLNFTGPTLACLRTSKNVTYKIGLLQASPTSNVTIQYLQEVAGSVGGSSSLNVSSSSGISYFNASLKSIRVSRFDFSTGETALTHGTDYNVTSANGVLVGPGNITIPGVGGIKLKPFGTWTSGFYKVQAEFNTSDGSEKAVTGFQVDSYSVTCYRTSWNSLQSGEPTQILCSVTNPGGGNYNGQVDLAVESVRMSTGASVSSSLWASSGNFTNFTRPSVIVTLNQTLGTGFYETVIKLNVSSDVKRQSIWFDVRDFDAFFYSTKWSYSAVDNISFVASGSLGSNKYRVNISGSPTVFRYDKATWAKSVVSGVSVNAQVDSNISGNVNVTVINLTKSGGWDEGQYVVTLNLTRINGSNVATGGASEVSSWFEVKLFDVYAYTSQWSYHPKSNVSIIAFVGSPGGFSQKYSSSVNVNITEVKNTLTGATLTKGTDYTVVDNTSVPSVTGDPVVKIVPVTTLPTGSYKATINVRDSVSGRTVKAEAYFTVIAFYLSAYADQYEVGAGENVSINIYTYSPSGASVNISDAVITSLQFCNSNYTCASKASSSFNYTFAKASSKISLNTTGFGQGSYTATISVNDSQNANASSTAYFRVKSFAMSGSIPYATGARSGYGYQINETLQLNVTASLGVNITNATFSYYDCTSSGCAYKSYVVQIGFNMTAKNALLNLTPANITPATLNRTWPVSEYASPYVTVRGLKDGVESTFYTWTNFYFPRATASGLGSVNTGGGISATITAYVEPITGQNLSGANITVTDVLQDTGFALTSLGASRWNVSSKIANSSGVADLTVQPNGSIWPSGNLRIRYSVVYGNASTKAEFTTAAAARSLGFGKGLTNRTGATIANASVGVPFNVSIILNNPSTVDSNGTMIIVYTPVHSTNTSAVITLLNNSGGNVTSEMRANVTAGSGAVVLNWQYNVSQGAGNYSQQILLQANSTFNTLGWITYSNTVAVGGG